MNNKMASYQQGGYDGECEFGYDEHTFEDAGINDDDSGFDSLEYLRGYVMVLRNELALMRVKFVSLENLLKTKLQGRSD